MKYTSTLSISVIVLFSIIGCDFQTKPKVIALNNTIVQTNDTLYLKGYALGTEIGNAWVTKDFSRISTLHRDMTDYIDRKTTEIEKLENVGGSEKLKATELAFLQFEKDMLAMASVFGTFDSATSEETFMAAAQQMQQSAQDEQQKLSEIQLIQKEYAEKNNIPLVKNQTVPAQ